MKRLYLTIAILGAAFAVTVGSPSATLAHDSKHGSYRSNHGQGQGYDQGYTQGRKHGYKYRKHHKRRKNSRHQSYDPVAQLLYNFGNFGKRGGKGGYDYGGGTACHPVSKDGYSRGRHARIGGTMCYDHYGQGYVVRGSRYVIHYY